LIKRELTAKIEISSQVEGEDEPTQPIAISQEMLLESALVNRLAVSKDESKFEQLGLHFARYKQSKNKTKAKGGGPNTDLSKRYGKKGKECKDTVVPEEDQ
jgi:hypothetical protein